MACVTALSAPPITTPAPCCGRGAGPLPVLTLQERGCGSQRSRSVQGQGRGEGGGFAEAEVTTGVLKQVSQSTGSPHSFPQLSKKSVSSDLGGIIKNCHSDPSS